MAKVNAPLLSFGARGQIGNAMVYATWKGRAYARQYVVPSNPRTTAQGLTRNAFDFLQAVYKVAPTQISEVWNAYARGKVMTDRNAWTKFNLPILRPAITLDEFVMSPGALGGLPPIDLEVTPGSGTLSLAIEEPAVLPTDWEIHSAIGAIIREQTPQSGTLYEIQAGEDETTAYVVNFSDLPASEFQCFAWLKWVRPDGQFAYSPSIQTQATPS